MFRKILAAVDSSERAAGVLEVAVGLARASAARLYLLRVVTIPPEFPAAAAGSPTDPLVAKSAGIAMHYLSQLIERAPRDVPIQPPIVRLGEPWKVILETANDRDVDLIVIGSHGYKGWDRVLGTTAAKIANVSERSVLVIHDRKAAATSPRDEGSSDPNEASGSPERKDTAGARVRSMAWLQR